MPKAVMVPGAIPKVVMVLEGLMERIKADCVSTQSSYTVGQQKAQTERQYALGSIYTKKCTQDINRVSN